MSSKVSLGSCSTRINLLSVNSDVGSASVHRAVGCGLSYYIPPFPISPLFLLLLTVLSLLFLTYQLQNNVNDKKNNTRMMMMIIIVLIVIYLKYQISI